MNSRFRVSIEICLTTLFFLMLAYSAVNAKTCFKNSAKGIVKDVGCACLKAKNCATLPDPLEGSGGEGIDPVLVNTIKQAKIAADAAMRGDKKSADSAIDKITTKENIKNVEKLFKEAKEQYNKSRVAKGLPPVDFSAKEKELMKSLRTKVGKDVAKGNLYGYKGKIVTSSNLKKNSSSKVAIKTPKVKKSNVAGVVRGKESSGTEMLIKYRYNVMDISNSRVPLFKAISTRYMKALFPLTLEEMESQSNKKIKLKK